MTTDTTLRPKNASIAPGKGYRLGGQDRSSEIHPSHGLSESSSNSRRQHHQADRSVILAAAERRADSKSKSKDDEESNNEHERLLK